MSLEQATILNAFINHFQEFIDDIADIFSDNVEIRKIKFSLELFAKGNPHLLCQMWRTRVGIYKEQLMRNDIDFFINKDYSHEISYTANYNKSQILDMIDNLRGQIAELSDSNKMKSLKYFQNLTLLSEMYTD